MPAFTFAFDPSLDHLDVDWSERGPALWLLWQVLSNAVQMFTINLKLRKLFVLSFAKCCDIVLCITFVANVAACGFYIANSFRDFRAQRTES